MRVRTPLATAWRLIKGLLSRQHGVVVQLESTKQPEGNGVYDISVMDR